MQAKPIPHNPQELQLKVDHAEHVKKIIAQINGDLMAWTTQCLSHHPCTFGQHIIHHA